MSHTELSAATVACFEDRPLPDIQVNGRELRELSEEVLQALGAANDPARLFARTGKVVRIDKDENGRPIIVDVNDVHLRGEMTRAANFHRLTKKGVDYLRISVSPPTDVAQDILSRPVSELDFPPLEAITESPFIRPDGSIVTLEGYDPATHNYYAPVGRLEAFYVPDRPTPDDIDGARDLIEDALADFPFTEQASRANAFAMFITTECRPAIPGNIPIALVDAPDAGTGKGLLASIVAEKSTGNHAAMRPAPRKNDEEWRKTITSAIRAGRPLTIFDNLVDVLDSPHLALAVTTRSLADRMLGRTEDLTLPQHTTFIVTGNNITLGGDIPRRCYWIRIDAKMAEPWRRECKQFRHNDLKAWVQANRGRLLGATLTLARAWFVAGRPTPSTPILGSFEEWCTIIGGILEFAGIPGFLGNLDELYKQADPNVAAWEAFLKTLFVWQDTAGFTVAEIVRHASDSQDFRAMLPESLGDMDKPVPFKIRLGKALRARVGKRYGNSGIHLERSGEKHNSAVWLVVREWE